jgi:hypothetical protein
MNVRRILRFVVLIAGLLIAGPAGISAEPYETIINNGDPQNRIDLVILGDGYTAAETQKFHNDVQVFVQGFFAQEPFREYQNYFNVHRIDVNSNQSGADHPERSVFVDTAFDAAYNCAGVQRLICVNTSKVGTVTLNTLTPAQRDITLVIVNDSEYGGSGGAVAVSSTNASAIEIILHEEGHSFGFLGDEYTTGPPPECMNTFEPPNANVTKETQRALIKWSAWIDPGTAIPTTSAVVGVPGLYEGAAYCTSGLFRPTFNSKMRSLGVPFEQINSEQLIKRVYDLVSPLDTSLPAPSSVSVTVGATQSFSATVPTPLTHALNVSWTLDGQPVANGLSFVLDGGVVSPGTHAVTVNVSDPTSQVRSDPNQLLKAQRTWTVTVGSAVPSVQFTAATYAQTEGSGTVDVVVTRSGDTTGSATINYQTSDDVVSINGAPDCSTVSGLALYRCDYLMTIGTLSFTPGETTKTIAIPIVDDSYAEGSEHFLITLSSPAGATLGSTTSATVTINDNDGVTGVNPINDPRTFVRQHYLDFLNREPDTAGWDFWTSQITACGKNVQCDEVMRINVSVSFFLSIEFQDTGYFVYRTYKAAHGSIGMPVPVRLIEFLPDTQQIGRGVQVGIGNWQAQLETNKQAYLLQFVQRLRFTSDYPTTRTPAEFVDKLFQNAGVSPSTAERNAAISEFGGATNTADLSARVRVLRRVAENPTLTQQEFNRAFVLMQYFGYLRRNPFDPPELTLDFQGYDFWLNKLNLFGGNYIDAEMVKAFLTSIEYRHRFGP